MSQSALRAAAFALAACLPLAVHAAETLTGAYALPDGRPRVRATLVATPGRSGVEMLDIAMTQLGKQHPVAKYETELSKQLHIIAISSDFRTFVHEHADRPATNGHFRVAVPLPRPGLYHIYADGVPSGIGQQVMRFELNRRPPHRSRRRLRPRTGAMRPGSIRSSCAPGRRASSACTCPATASPPPT